MAIPDLSKLARYVVPVKVSAEPAKTALQTKPPAIQGRPAPHTGTLMGGNLGPNTPLIQDQPLAGIVAEDSSGKTPDTSLAGGTAAATSESSEVFKAADWPRSTTPRPPDQRLRERYLWRAWLEDATEFHATRTNGEPLRVYQPGEGYAVLTAAYQPMIQAVDPKDRAPEGRSIYQDRRGPRLAPGEEEVESEAAAATARSAGKAKTSGTGGLAGFGGQSFQPWDSQIMTDPFGPANSLVSKVPGLRIEKVVLFQGFSSNGFPIGRGQSPFVNPNLGYDIDVGALATIAWSHARPTGGFFMSYTPSRIQRKRFPEWNSTDHQLNLGATKNFARWNIAVNNNNAVRGLQQVLFSPAVLRQVPNAPTNFDDLLAAAQDGQLSSDEIASVLTGSPVVDAQPETRFDQTRVLSSSLGVSAAHVHSARLSSHFGMSGSHFQTIKNPTANDANLLGQQGLDRSTSVGGDAGLSYKLSPETSVGLDSSVNRNYSSFRDSSSVNTTASVSRRLGRRWAVSTGAGVGTVQWNDPYAVASVSPATRRSATWIVNGALNYSGRTHSFGVNASRNAGDSVGLGATTSERAGVNWNWSRPGSAFGLHAEAEWYRLSLNGLGDAQSGFVGFGLVRRLSRETAFQTNYTYQTFQSPFRGVVSNLSGHRVQMSWVWRPTGPPR